MQKCPCPQTGGLRVRHLLMLELINEVTQCLSGFTCPPLEASKEFVIFALLEKKVIVSKLGVLVLHLAFDFVPVAFYVKFSHWMDKLIWQLDPVTACSTR